ncbi:MAG: phage terminase large subunit [Lachnospiraceae bacterium]|nr:phage terminase large subunit [Lachnospiraceae bacterium]
MDIEITEKQDLFINSKAFETLFGGAAGGGKSYGQLVDALLYALKYPKSKQIIFRRTFPDLERSIIRTSLEFYPKEVASYNSSKHIWRFKNGSIIDFGYIDNENDVYQYQSAEYDVIRFDELTHFTEYMYVYMISRCRGANPYPKYIKSSTNPGGIGHSWVKERFIDIGEPNKIHNIKQEDGTTTSRIFIPSLVQDNLFLMANDPDYLKRLQNLPEKEKKALLYGEWDIFDGQFFTEFKRDIHVCKPFEIPKTWRIFRTRDYGLDMCACYWIALDWNMNAYVYKELYESNLIVSEAARKINEMTTEDIYCDYAPPDLWNRNRDTGKSTSDIFAESGQYLTKADNNRVTGWLAVHEWLKVIEDEQGQKTCKLHIFSNCVNLIRTLPAVQHDEKNPNDVANEPHELTHAPDALRYFCTMYQLPKSITMQLPDGNYTKTELEDLGYINLTTIKSDKSKPLNRRRR